MLKKGILDPYVLLPFSQKFISKLLMSVRTHDYGLSSELQLKLTLDPFDDFFSSLQIFFKKHNLT